MLKLRQLSFKRRLSQAKGFTMVEVMAAILMTTAFIAATLQVMVVNVYFKVHAKRQAQAMFWIQEDKEQIRAIASDVTLVDFDQAQCKAYATYLKTRLGELNYPETNADKSNAISKTVLGKIYKLRRIYTPDTTDPAILKIDYQVIEYEDSTLRNGKVIEQSHTEVQPYAKNACS